MSRAAATKTAMAVWMSSATISALIATANRCATSSIGNGVTEGNGIKKAGSHRVGCVAHLPWLHELRRRNSWKSCLDHRGGGEPPVHQHRDRVRDQFLHL